MTFDGRDGVMTAGAPLMPAFSVGSLGLEISAPGRPQLNKASPVEIKVTNHAREPAEGAGLEVRLPNGVRFDSAEPRPSAGTDEGTLRWDLGSIAGGQTRTVAVRVTPSRANPIRLDVIATQRLAATFEAEVAEPRISIDVTGPEQVNVGREFEAIATISNVGEIPVTGVKRELLPAVGVRPVDHDQSPIRLQPGESTSVKLKLVADRAGPAGIKVTATANDGGKPITGELTFEVIKPELLVSLTGPDRESAGRPASFEIRVSNRGTGAESEVATFLEFPADVEVIDLDGGEVDRSGRFIRWITPTLEAGRQIVHTATVRARGATTARIRASAESREGTIDEAERTIRFDGSPRLSLRLDPARDGLGAGGTGEFLLVIRNRGAVSAERIELTVTPSREFRIETIEGRAPETVVGGSNGHRLDRPLAPGEEVSIRLGLKGVAAGTGRIQIEATVPNHAAARASMSEAVPVDGGD
jgi:hypothetical protein